MSIVWEGFVEGSIVSDDFVERSIVSDDFVEGAEAQLGGAAGCAPYPSP